MKTLIGGNGVKVAKVVKEMQDFISTPGSYPQKCKDIWNIEIDGRPGKEDAKALREKYLHKFDYFTERNITGRCPRGIEQYGHRVKFGVIQMKNSWNERFSNYISGLYKDANIHYSLVIGLNTYKVTRDMANEVRKFHLAEIERLRTESEILFKKAAAQRSEYDSYFLKQNFPYREASGKWAGGHTFVNVYIADIDREGTGTSKRVWSLNGKWSGLDAHYAFYINQDDALIVIGGLVTVYKKSEEKERIKSCTWWEQGKGFELVKRTGFLVDGYHSEAKTKELAIKGAKQSKNYVVKNQF